MSPESEFICILDDDASVRHSIEQLLDSDGLKALSFEDAKVFLRMPTAIRCPWPCSMYGCQRRAACKCRRCSAGYCPIRK